MFIWELEEILIEVEICLKNDVNSIWEKYYELKIVRVVNEIYYGFN